jgi:hypothetical protein
MPPSELECLGEGWSYGLEADVWRCGIVLNEMLVGRSCSDLGPFKGGGNGET